MVVRKFRFRFSLRTMLLVATALCIGPGGWIVYKRNQTEAHRHAKQELEKLRINFATCLNLQGTQSGPRPNQPAWERVLFGDDLSEQGNVVFLFAIKDSTILDESLCHCRELPNLFCLHLKQSSITDEGLSRCEALSQLEMLDLAETQISDAGLAHLVGLANLRKLDLRGTRVTGEGISNLQRALPRLEIYR